MKKLLQKAIPRLYGFYFNILHLFSNKKAADLALKVFSIPRSGFITPIQQEYLDTARQQQIAYEDGLFMLYHWKGNGPTVLLNHGWESSTWRWKHLIEPLQKLDYNIIAIDAPAHGNTTGTLFTAVKYSKIIATTIDLYKPSIIIAHSVGAMATVYQESSAQHECLEKLVLLGSPNSLEVIMRGYQDLVGFGNSVYGSLNNLLKKTYDFKIEEFNTADFASKIEVPTLIVHHPDDQIVPYKAMEAIAAKMPNATTYTSQTGGHSLYTQEVIDQSLRFLDAEELENS
jgi:pimeloyl-ACP methyl ester carboxylesterase